MLFRIWRFVVGYNYEWEELGIRLVPVNGHEVPVPGHGSNNGHYSDELTLVLSGTGSKEEKRFNITECQGVNDY